MSAISSDLQSDVIANGRTGRNERVQTHTEEPHAFPEKSGKFESLGRAANCRFAALA
jgi:hypothetical protein